MKDGYMIMSINACIRFLSRNRSKRRWVAGASLRVQVMMHRTAGIGSREEGAASDARGGVPV